MFRIVSYEQKITNSVPLPGSTFLISCLCVRLLCVCAACLSSVAPPLQSSPSQLRRNSSPACTLYQGAFNYQRVGNNHGCLLLVSNRLAYTTVASHR